MKTHLWSLALGILISFYTPASFAIRVHFFDIDGTLVHDSGVDSNGKLPAWWTYWVLKRMSHVNNGFHVDQYERLLEEGELPDEILVNRSEIDNILRHKLATREERAGDTSKTKLMKDPIQELNQKASPYNGLRPQYIYPGYYRIVPEISYRYHEDWGAERNFLLLSYKSANARMLDSPRKYEWRGPAFPLFVQALSKQGANERVSILTDRRHSDSNLLEWLGAMYKDGYVPNPTAQGKQGEVFKPRLISTTNAGARNFGSIFDFDQRKANAIAEKVAQIDRSPAPREQVLSADRNEALSGVLRPAHEVIVYENRPNYVAPLLNTMKKLAAQYPNVKLYLFHAGSPQQVLGANYNQHEDSAKWSRWLVFTPSGKGWRQPTDAELLTLEPKGHCSSYLGLEAITGNNGVGR